MLKYHQKVFDKLNIEPILSPERMELIEKRENICKVKFPASIKEWFSIQHAEKIFHDNSNSDNLVPLEKLGNPDEASQGYLQVAYENQAVVAWYVQLNNNDDPSVYDNNDEFGKNLAEVDWHKVADSFSSFIYKILSSDK